MPSTGAKRTLDGLNPEQKQAVQAIEGPLLVLAGAGSGKTLVIIRRIAQMLAQGIAAQNILAVTFTNKAADEMRNRLSRMVGEVSRGVHMSTFHSLGLYLLKAELALRRRGSRFAIYDTADQLSCLREIARRLDLGRSFDLGAVLARISAFKNAFLTPESIEPRDDPYHVAAAAFYQPYLEAMEALAAVDFDDLICRPTRMMEESRACKERWAGHFRYVLVDEYQDTNAAQLRLLRAIAGGHRNLCVVGDDDQSIYAWRGAEVRNILQFEADFPGSRVIALTRNYRSVESVLTLANAVIGKNAHRHPKELVADRGAGAPVKLVVTEDGEAEANLVAERITERLTGGVRPSQVAILYRSNILSRGFETALRQHHVRYRLLGGKSYFDRKEVKDLVAYLKVCLTPADSLSLRRILNWPPRGIGAATVGKLSRWAEEHEQPFFRALENAGEILAGEDRARAAVDSFWQMISRQRRALRGGADLTASVRGLIDEIGMRDQIRDGEETGAGAERRLANIDGFLQGVEAACRDGAGVDLHEFLNRLALNELDDDVEDEPGERVTLSTLHGAKGLEWPLVFLVGVEEGLLPHNRVMNPHVTDAYEGSLDEERRLFYVGITRARDELVLTRAAQRSVAGRAAARGPSRFLADVPGELLVCEDRTKPLSTDQARERLRMLRQSLKL